MCNGEPCKEAPKKRYNGSTSNVSTTNATLPTAPSRYMTEQFVRVIHELLFPPKAGF